MAADWIPRPLESIYPESINVTSVKTSTDAFIFNTTDSKPAMDEDKALIDYVGYIFVPLLLVLGISGNSLTILNCHVFQSIL